MVLIHNRTARAALLVATIVLTPLVLLLRSSESSAGRMSGLYDSLSSSFPSSSSSSSSSCPSTCVADPFIAPGMIYWGENSSETRWVPFLEGPGSSSSFQDGEEEGEEGKLTEATMYEELDQDELERSAPPYLKWLVRGQLEELEFMRGKMVLFVGSSHDRNNVEQVCGETKGKYDSWGGHVGGICTIPQLNFTLVNWFSLGMIDSQEDLDHWLPNKPEPALFSARVEETFLPKMLAAGLSKAPDLVIFASLFWDDAYLNWHRAHYKFDPSLTTPQNGFNFAEINWHRIRVRAAILQLRRLWGTDLPLMFRTRQLRKKDENWSIMKIYQLDQSCRSVAKELGVKLFSWGERLEGYTKYYDGDMHFASGPTTYLFADMTFFYLQRALTPGCWNGCD